MVELRFRVWTGKRFEYNVYVLPSGACEYVSSGDGKKIPVSRENVQQYTGVNDLHGIGIFEGDFVKVSYWVNYEDDPKKVFFGTVKFGKCGLSYTSEAPQHESVGFYIKIFAPLWEDEDKLGLFPDHNFCDGYVTLVVLGNIHENLLSVDIDKSEIIVQRK